MPERDIYQIVLQLKDELSAELKEINSKLGQTRTAGKQAEDATRGFVQSIKTSLQPMRDFARMVREVMMIGGLTIIARQIASALGNMQMAFEKANPEAARAEGSLTRWNAAVKESQASVGGMIDRALNPLRAFLIDLIAPLAGVRQAMIDVNAQFDIFAAKYAGDELKNALAITQNLADRTTALAALNRLYAEQADLLVKIQKAETANKNAIPSTKWNFGEALAGAMGAAAAPTTTQQYVAGQEQRAANDLLAMRQALSDLTKEIEKNQKIFSDMIKWTPNKSSSGGAAGTTIAGGSLPWWTHTGISGPMEQVPEAAAAASMPWWIHTGISGPLEQVVDVLFESKDLLLEGNKLAEESFDWQKEFDKGAAQLTSAQGLFSNPSTSLNSLLSGAASSVAGNVEVAKAAGFDISLGMQVAQLFGTIGTDLAALLASAAAMAPLLLIITGIMLVFEGIMEILGPSIDGIWKPIAAVFDLLGNTIGTLLLPIFQALEPVISAICLVLSPFINLLMLFEPLFKLIGAVIKVVLLPVMIIVKAIVDIMNLVISGLNWAFGWAGVNVALVPSPALPTFHEGGVANDEMVALLKKGEIVTNPYKNTGYVAGGAGGPIGGITINAPNARYLDASTAAELVKLGLVAMRA